MEKGKQVYIYSLFITCLATTVFLAIFRLIFPNLLVESVKLPNLCETTQSIILLCLMIFELFFVYKILLYKNKNITCLVLAILQSLIGREIPSYNWTSAFHMFCLFVIPLILNKNFRSLLRTTFLYGIELIYCSIFLFAKFGKVEACMADNFYYSVLSVLDYKLFIVTIYLLKEVIHERNKKTKWGKED